MSLGQRAGIDASRRAVGRCGEVSRTRPRATGPAIIHNEGYTSKLADPDFSVTFSERIFAGGQCRVGALLWMVNDWTEIDSRVG